MTEQEAEDLKEKFLTEFSYLTDRDEFAHCTPTEVFDWFVAHALQPDKAEAVSDEEKDPRPIEKAPKTKIRNKQGIKPCPFCARQPILSRWHSGLYSIECKCGAQSPSDSKSELGVKRSWNRRRLEDLNKQRP